MIYYKSVEGIISLNYKKNAYVLCSLCFKNDNNEQNNVG